MEILRKRKISLRQATTEDSAKILEWRNDPVTRKYSFSTRRISEADHHRWFRQSLASGKRLLLMALCDKKPIGIVRFDFYAKTRVQVNINLAPDERGKGFGALVLSSGKKWLCRKTPVRFILAKVKDQNIASKKAFENAGFTKIRKVNKVFYYRAVL